MPEPLVLCYHAVSARWPAGLAVEPQRLEEQLSLLLRRGYVATTLSRALSEPPGRRTLAVTFDDAFHSVYELAFPILSRLGIPATVFVPTAFAGKHEPMCWPGIDEWLGTDHQHELRCCSWEELATLAEHGWEIGSHTRTHPHLTALADEDLTNELRDSRIECEDRLGRACRSLAFPYGDYDARVVAAAGSHYSYACTLPRRFPVGEPLAWPRVGVYRRDDMARFRLKASAVVRGLRSSPAWPRLSWVCRGISRRRATGR